MMKRRLLPAFAFAFAFAAVAVAVAGQARACTGFAVNVLQTSATSYSPAELTTNRLTIKLSTAGPIDSACDTLTVTVGPHDWDPRPMVLQNGTSELLGSDPGTPNAVRVGRDLQLTPTAVQQLVAGQPIYLDIQDITAGQFVRSGSYVSLITVVAGDRTQDLSLEAVVQPVILLQGSSADGQEDIDLGVLEDGASGETSVFYRTNAELNISIESQNRGYLVHERGVSFGQIAYLATFGGQALDLTNPGAALSFGFSQLGLQSQVIAVTAPSVPPAYAGAYRDTLTISFMPY